MMAVSLSGGLDSPFLLLSLTPIMLAGVFGGFRSGLATAGLAAGVLIVITVGIDDFDLPMFFQWAGLYLLIGFTFGQARRLLVEEGARADALAAASLEVSLRLDRLERANSLLTRFEKRPTRPSSTRSPSAMRRLRAWRASLVPAGSRGPGWRRRSGRGGPARNRRTE